MVFKEILISKQKLIVKYGRGARFFSHSLRSWKKSAGFTLVELAIVIALIAIISAVALLWLTTYRGSQNLKLTMSEFITVIRDTQKRSITQEDGSGWGVRLANLQSGDSQYAVFKGLNYASGTVDRVYTLGRGIKFSEPSASSTYEAVFASVSGNFSKNKIISLVGGRGDFTVGDIIINILGLITSRIEKDVFGYWHFDEGSGNTANDASGAGRNGTIWSDDFPCAPCQNWQGGAGCKSGDCLFFQNSQIYPPPPPHYVAGFLDQPVEFSAFTIEAWVKLNGNQNKAGIWTGYDENAFNKISGRFLASSKKPSFYTKSDGGSGHETTVSGGGLKTIGRWYHLAYVYDDVSNSKKIYIDGRKDKEEAVPDGEKFTIYFFDIGRNEADNSYVLDGYLDEVKFYKRALSDDEISSHYNDFK